MYEPGKIFKGLLRLRDAIEIKRNEKPEIGEVQRPVLTEWSIAQRPINTIARNNETGILKDEQ